jgi:hypothetical protein
MSVRAKWRLVTRLFTLVANSDGGHQWLAETCWAELYTLRRMMIFFNIAQ